MAILRCVSHLQNAQKLHSWHPISCLVPSPPPPSFSPRGKTSPHVATRFAVSCTAGGNRNDNPKLDRRDMLLGLGGLYGATNLAPAMAEPIPPPPLDKCTKATDVNTGEVFDFNCCPPTGPSLAPDYVLPAVSKLRVRPALHLASNEYLAKFEKAVQAMKDLSAKDPNDPRGFTQQSHVHCAYCNLAYPQAPGSDEKLQIHFSWFFFPWHRWYLYFYERICAKLIGDPTFALPFWNWDNPPGMVMPDIFTNETSPLYNPKRNLTHYPPEPADLAFDGDTFGTNVNPTEKIIANNLSEMYIEMIQNGNCRDLTNFYGGKYSVGSEAKQNKMGTVEAGSHTALHRWVGTNTDNGFDMGNFATAGNDMLFFCHHFNIDRLWTVWRDFRYKQGKPKDFPDRDWLDTKFVFYDENAKLVTVRVADSLDNKKMGFTWQDVDNPWFNSKPKALVKKSTFAKKSNAPKPVDIKFPVKLDKVLRILVDRPKTGKSAKETEETLVIKLDVEATKFLRFEVFVNDEDVKPFDLIATASYAGCYSQMPTGNPRRVQTELNLCLGDLLEELDVEDDDKILVSVVPKKNGEFITIDGINIKYGHDDA